MEARLFVRLRCVCHGVSTPLTESVQYGYATDSYEEAVRALYGLIATMTHRITRRLPVRRLAGRSARAGALKCPP